MSASEISQTVLAAKDIREAQSLDEELQRSLRERASEIANYLCTREQRFFNSIIIGVYEGLPEWHEFIIDSKIEELGGDSESLSDTVGLLEFTGLEKMFAIDGQHRVAGIKHAFDNSVDLSTKALNCNISEDRYAVILVAHIDDTSGRKRTRQLFSDINRKAKSVPKKDQIIIDEETLTHIVTRRVYAEYKYFSNGTLIDHIHENTNLKNDDFEHFTNLTNLNTAITKLKPLYTKKRKSNEWDEANVVSLKDVVINFLDTIIENIPEYRAFFIDKSVSLQEVRKNNSYILFRPVGFTLLSKLYAYYAKRKSINEFTSHISKLNFVSPTGDFDKILWNNGKMEAKANHQSLAYTLSLYLLGNDVDTDKLLSNYRRILKNENIELPERKLVRKSS
jgi:DNA sulfur modification protein DndB